MKRLLFFLLLGGFGPTMSPAHAQEWSSGFVTDVWVSRLPDEVLANPKDADLSKSHPQAWASQAGYPDLPEDLRSRAFVNRSVVLLEVDDRGLAAGCRPILRSAQPRLDDFSCKLLMEPRFFSATLLPPKESVAGRWAMSVRWETMSPATWKARQAQPKPRIDPSPMRLESAKHPAR